MELIKDVYVRANLPFSLLLYLLVYRNLFLWLITLYTYLIVKVHIYAGEIYFILDINEFIVYFYVSLYMCVTILIITNVKIIFTTSIKHLQRIRANIVAFDYKN